VSNSSGSFNIHLQAHALAFAPFAFQTARFMRDHGLLAALQEAGRKGATLFDLAKETGLSDYAVESVCEASLSFGLVTRNTAEKPARWKLTPVGYLVLTDPTVRINMDFTHHVCYRGLFHLEEALLEGRPAGLPELGDWSTIYEGLSQLPEDAQKAWFAFDHYYSDAAMPEALPHVLASKPRNFLDIGGNTGRASRLVAGLDADVHITIADLPGQIRLAAAENEKAGIAHRVSGHPVDMLDPDSMLPTDFDVVWMSQFLVCFSKVEIVSILERARKALAPKGRVWILDTYWDHTDNAIAEYCLHGTSLYFTAMANGNSRMYSLEDTEKLIRRAGLQVVERIDGLGRAHTLLACEAV
jgi:SAM-dependent methyltransferase